MNNIRRRLFYHILIQGSMSLEELSSSKPSLNSGTVTSGTVIKPNPNPQTQPIPEVTVPEVTAPEVAGHPFPVMRFLTSQHNNIIEKTRRSLYVLYMYIPSTI